MYRFDNEELQTTEKRTSLNDSEHEKLLKGSKVDHYEDQPEPNDPSAFHPANKHLSSGIMVDCVSRTTDVRTVGVDFLPTEDPTECHFGST